MENFDMDMVTFQVKTAVKYLKDHPDAIVTVVICCLIAQIALASIAGALDVQLIPVVLFATFVILVIFTVYIVYVSSRQ